MKKIRISKHGLVLLSSAIIALGATTGVASWVFSGTASNSIGCVISIGDRTFDSITAKVSSFSLSANRICSHRSASSGTGYDGVAISNYYTVVKNGETLSNSSIASAISSGTLKITTTGDATYSNGYIKMKDLTSSASTGSKDATISLSFSDSSSSSSNKKDNNKKLETYTIDEQDHHDHEDDCLDCSKSLECFDCHSTCLDCNENNYQKETKTNQRVDSFNIPQLNKLVASNSSSSSNTISGTTNTTEGSWTTKSGSESYTYSCGGTIVKESSTSYYYECDDCGRSGTYSEWKDTCGESITTYCSGTITRTDNGYYSYYCDDCGASSSSSYYGDTCGKLLSYAVYCDGTCEEKTSATYGCSECSRTGSFSGTCGKLLSYSTSYYCSSCGKSYSSNVGSCTALKFTTCGGAKALKSISTCGGSIGYSAPYWKCTKCSTSYGTSKPGITSCTSKTYTYWCSVCGTTYSSGSGYCTAGKATTCGGSITSSTTKNYCSGTCEEKTSATYGCSECSRTGSFSGTCGKLLSSAVYCTGTVTRKWISSYSYYCDDCGASSSSSYYGDTCGKSITTTCSGTIVRRSSTTYYYECDDCGRSGSSSEVGDTCYKTQYGTRSYSYCSVCNDRL